MKIREEILEPKFEDYPCKKCNKGMVQLVFCIDGKGNEVYKVKCATCDYEEEPPKPKIKKWVAVDDMVKELEIFENDFMFNEEKIKRIGYRKHISIKIRILQNKLTKDQLNDKGDE